MCGFIIFYQRKALTVGLHIWVRAVTIELMDERVEVIFSTDFTPRKGSERRLLAEMINQHSDETQ